ncbi:hypothetical protein RCOM_1314600 [Ricinus communis]|uniref:F-box domain-containing protein n=1 Tax=Ricinus communis TaxID=3988 RepID=B9RYX7_RICCO|nr:hypothetical protein RCOM_1314600 [Ricinus communis]|eukprot:XP_002518946.1 probable F-box protein At2g36090 [Ricinus communis]
MEHPMICHLQGVNEDLLADIMHRLDGLALASLASTSTYFRRIVRHHTSWKHLCHSTWPSTAYRLLSPSIIHRFDNLFADAYPLILYDDMANDNSCELETTTSSCDFVSLVDVYYKNQCVLSKSLEGIPETVDAFQTKFTDANWDTISGERQQWFLNCPFKLQILDTADYDEDDLDLSNGNLGDTNNDERSTPLPLSPADQKTQDHCKELTRDLRLSRILLDTKAGRAVNLSSWKPFSVQSIWPHQGNHVMHFGSVIPVEETLPPGKLVRCKITTKFKVTERQGYSRWRDISMSIEGVSGATVNGRKSLMILNKALYSPRSTNQLKVENGLNQYEKHKKEMAKRREKREKLTNWLYISIEIAMFAVSCHALTRLF